MSPLLAQSGHASRMDECLLLGVKRTLRRAMKILFLATAACLVCSLSSSAQPQKDKFSDQYCGRTAQITAKIQRYAEIGSERPQRARLIRCNAIRDV
jgi:hypothetical protein